MPCRKLTTFRVVTAKYMKPRVSLPLLHWDESEKKAVLVTAFSYIPHTTPSVQDVFTAFRPVLMHFETHLKAESKLREPRLYPRLLTALPFQMKHTFSIVNSNTVLTNDLLLTMFK